MIVYDFFLQSWFVSLIYGEKLEAGKYLFLLPFRQWEVSFTIPILIKAVIHDPKRQKQDSLGPFDRAQYRETHNWLSWGTCFEIQRNKKLSGDVNISVPYLFGEANVSRGAAKLIT